MNPRLFKQQLLDELYKPYEQCVQCPLGLLGRKQVVFGQGNPDSPLMFIGEAPGRDEDEQGKPFVGRSGKLLNKALISAGIERESIFITNIVKCRPPENRLPAPIEASTCKKLLLNYQIKIVRPKVICTLGSFALNNLMNNVYQITKIRGSLLKNEDGIIVVPVYHPAYVLRNPREETTFFKDIAALKSIL